MAKAKTLAKRKTSSESIVQVNRKLLKKREPFVAILDKNKIMEAIAECLKESDFAGILEIIQIYLRAQKRASKQENNNETTTSYRSNQWPEQPSNGMAKIAHTRDRNIKKVL